MYNSLQELITALPAAENKNLLANYDSQIGPVTVRSNGVNWVPIAFNVAIDEGAGGLTFATIFNNLSQLETEYPAATNSGSYAIVFIEADSEYYLYKSNGVNWLLVAPE